MKILIASIFLISINSTNATTWQVGPTRTYKFCSQLASLVANGDTIEIDVSTYINDSQVKWTKNNLLIIGIGGRPRLEAGNLIANDMVNGKGIFVISGANVKVENIEFANAKVQDHNGAGIRQEGANLFVTKCKFDANEMGILCGNIANCKTTVEYSEFINGGSLANPGYQHNIYINHIDTFLFRFNYSHDAIAEGHELKSRANYNFILYNRISNEQSADSRTIDLPNGGTSVVVGNIIEQGPNSANSNLLGYGLEGLSNPIKHNLWICSNTFVNRKSTGSFIHVSTGMDTLFIRNNIFAGAKTAGLLLGSPTVLDSTNNWVEGNIGNLNFMDEMSHNYHLNQSSGVIDAGMATGKIIQGHALDPIYTYEDTCGYDERKIEGSLDIGAFELEGSTKSKDQTPIHSLAFPNPCKDEMFFFENENGPFRIYDTNGRLVQTGTGNFINTASLPIGNYFLINHKGSMIFTKAN